MSKVTMDFSLDARDARALAKMIARDGYSSEGLLDLGNRLNREAQQVEQQAWDRALVAAVEAAGELAVALDDMKKVSEPSPHDPVHATCKVMIERVKEIQRILEEGP